MVEQTMTWLWILGAVLLAIVIVVAIVPRRVSYSESIVIAAPAREIYDHIRFQSRLMRWSAWPTETGSACTCEGTDGAIGARAVFLTKKGARFGQQEVTRLVPDRAVELVLTSKGPPQRPVVTFDLEPVTAETTRVTLRFDNRITPPFNVILRVAGIVRWTRAMHVKDLAGLKAYAEPPHRTYAGVSATELGAIAA